MSSQATSDFRRRRKANLVKVCGDKCNLCGYNKTIAALEFHHINPEDKEYNIAAKGTCHQLETDLKEAQKCILVCANCHREIHENLYNKDFLLSNRIFIEDIANALIEERNKLQEKTHYYCKTCGKEISRGAIYCSECVKETRRVVQDRPNREELKQLIRAMPFTHIGKQYGVSDNTIRKWCKNYSLPSKVSEIKKITDEKWETI